MVGVFVSSAVDHEFQSQPGQTKDYKIGIYCFSAKHAAWEERAKNDWFWIRIMCQSTNKLLFQGVSTIKIQLVYWFSTK
jgi:hypothetical protein